MAGLPTGEQKWVRRSLRNLAQVLRERGYSVVVCRMTVCRLLKKLDYKLVSNRKSLTGDAHPDRDRQFRYINRIRRLFLKAGLPVISVATKNKELIGNFHNQGRTWAQQAKKVNIHNFPESAIGRAVPYGIYDLAHNQGYVYVGTAYDTPEFAAYAIAQWWHDPHRPHFKCEDMLLILCDADGSNNCRYWLWKQHLQELLADQFGIIVMVCHYPTGASRYNPIEYRLFSQISINWAGKPLRSFSTMLSYIRDTTTQMGLTVKAFLVERRFENGRKVSKKESAAINLKRRLICPNWNYLISPRALPDTSLVKC